MLTLDLTPEPRRTAHLRAARIRHWTVAGTAYTLVLAVTVMIVRSQLRYDRNTMEAQIREVTLLNEHTRKKVEALNEEKSELDSELAASRAIGGQPDWSIPLAIIANAFEGDGVFQSIRVDPVFPPVASGKTVGRGRDEGPTRLTLPNGYIALIEGMCATDQTLTDLIRSLERSELFTSVRWIESSRERYLERDLIRFRLECTVEGE